jgi:hypothetical protein
MDLVLPWIVLHTQLINIEVQAQEQRMAPMPSPDGPPHP